MEWFYKSISILTIIGAGLWVLSRYYIQKKIDSYFHSNLAIHKQELNDLTERTKYDLSKKLFDFEAYAIKKHDVYPVIYNNIVETFNKMKSFQKEIEAEFVLEENRCYDLTNDYQIDFDRELLYFKFISSSAVREVHENAVEYYSNNELFISESVAIECDHVLKLMGNMVTCYLDHHYDKPVLNKYLVELESKIEDLKKRMQGELSYSHQINK